MNLVSCGEGDVDLLKFSSSTQVGLFSLVGVSMIFFFFWGGGGGGGDGVGKC